MMCPKCQTRWADFPIDITKEKMTQKQEAERLIVFESDDYKLCLNCQADMWEHTYYDY